MTSWLGEVRCGAQAHAAQVRPSPGGVRNQPGSALSHLTPTLKPARPPAISCPARQAHWLASTETQELAQDPSRDQLIDTVRSAEITLALARDRYLHGMADFIQVLNAEETLLSTR
jgi:hypothetical protein